MDICGICINEYNKREYLKITCECGFSCCKKCIKQYTLGIFEEMHCMNCKVVWDNQFINLNFDKTFVCNEYKKHKQEILFNHEKRLLHKTQHIVEKKIQLEELYNEQNNINQQMSELYNKKNEIKNKIYDLKNNTQINTFTKIKRCPSYNCKGFLRNNLSNTQKQKSPVISENECTSSSVNSNNKHKNKNKYKCSLPTIVEESDNQLLICGLCKCDVCDLCNEIVSDKENGVHVCNKDTIESIKLIEKDSKKCPSCYINVYKIDGCSSMYCYKCNVAFNWNTLKIEKNLIEDTDFRNHILHKNGIPSEIANSERIITTSFIRDLISKHYFIGLNDLTLFKDISLLVMKLTKKFTIPTKKENTPLSVNYMLNKIDQKKYKSMLFKYDKEYDKKISYYNVISNYTNKTTEILYKIYNCKGLSFKSELDELNKLRIETNEKLNDVSKVYNSIKYHLSDDYHLLIR